MHKEFVGAEIEVSWDTLAMQQKFIDLVVEWLASMISNPMDLG